MNRFDRYRRAIQIAQSNGLPNHEIAKVIRGFTDGPNPSPSEETLLRALGQRWQGWSRRVVDHA